MPVHELHGIYLLHQFGFEVGGFILVDDGTFSQFIDDGDHLRQFFRSHSLILKSSEITQGVTHGLGVISVGYSSRLTGADSFFC